MIFFKCFLYAPPFNTTLINIEISYCIRFFFFKYQFDDIEFYFLQDQLKKALNPNQ